MLRHIALTRTSKRVSDTLQEALLAAHRQPHLASGLPCVVPLLTQEWQHFSMFSRPLIQRFHRGMFAALAVVAALSFGAGSSVPAQAASLQSTSSNTNKDGVAATPPPTASPTKLERTSTIC